MSALEEADQEIRARAIEDEAFKHAWWLHDSSKYAWMKAWKEELFPALVLCRQLDAVAETEFRLSRPYAPCSDLTLARRGVEETFEVSMAFKSPASGINPGYQEALRWEKLCVDGSVSATSLLRRDQRTGAVEYAEDDIARSISEDVQSWAEGLEWTLRKKQRPGYGSGKSLLVYGDGMSGDFEYPRREAKIEDIVAHIPADARTNEFDRTIIVGWHPGWISVLNA